MCLYSCREYNHVSQLGFAQNSTEAEELWFERNTKAVVLKLTVSVVLHAFLEINLFSSVFQ